MFSDPGLTTLQFQTWWVTAQIEIAEIVIYGGDTPTGPWTTVWVPLSISSRETSDRAWVQTNFLTQSIQTSFPFYKIELHGRYPVGSTEGFKVTGVYFRTTGIGGAPTMVVTPKTNTIPSPTPTFQARKAGDVNEDGLVNLTDFIQLLFSLGRSVPQNTGADFNGDGQVNLSDLSTLLANFGQ
ncbi:hypothetical protein HY469_02145 [Candidatus Roizmanbacteria bacterium]|nr:hypothetical protein [Candidatus Roizmanbacteria bacterium]